MPGIVQLNSRGPDALLAQQCLKKAGYYKYALDSYFGPLSVSALKAFQAATGHTPDGVCGPKTWPDLLKYAPAPVPTDPLIKAVQEAVGGTFTNFTGFYNLVKKEIYGAYPNDIYPQGKAIERMRLQLPLNCSDFSQIGRAVALALGGYTCDYVHVFCPVSRIGHIRLRIKGKEFGDTWKVADLAAAAQSDYPLGSGWCMNGPLIDINPAWLMSDDGIT